MASALQKKHVAPGFLHLSKSLASTNLAETGFFMQPEAGSVFRKNVRLQGPEAGSLGLPDETAEKSRAGSLSAAVAANVDADLGYPSVDAAM